MVNVSRRARKKEYTNLIFLLRNRNVFKHEYKDGLKMDKQTCEDRIRKLVGKTIFTLKQKRANKLIHVKGRELIFEGRVSRPNIEDIWDIYQLLNKEGILTESNTPPEYFDRRIARIIYALLVEIAPDEIEPKKDGLSGIKLKQKV